MLVDIHAVKGGEIIGQTPGLKTFPEKRNVKGVAVKMDQDGEASGILKEGCEHVFFRVRRVGKPLGQMPCFVAAADAADQIYLVIGAGKAGGFDVKKEKFVWLS